MQKLNHLNNEIRDYVTNFSYVKHSMLWTMGWKGHVACMGEMGNADSVFVGKPEVNENRLEIIVIDGKLIFNLVLKELD